MKALTHWEDWMRGELGVSEAGAAGGGGEEEGMGRRTVVGV